MLVIAARLKQAQSLMNSDSPPPEKGQHGLQERNQEAAAGNQNTRTTTATTCTTTTTIHQLSEDVIGKSLTLLGGNGHFRYAPLAPARRYSEPANLISISRRSRLVEVSPHQFPARRNTLKMKEPKLNNFAFSGSMLQGMDVWT